MYLLARLCLFLRELSCYIFYHREVFLSGFPGDFLVLKRTVLLINYYLCVRYRKLAGTTTLANRIVINCTTAEWVFKIGLKVSTSLHFSSSACSTHCRETISKSCILCKKKREKLQHKIHSSWLSSSGKKYWLCLIFWDLFRCGSCLFMWSNLSYNTLWKWIGQMGYKKVQAFLTECGSLCLVSIVAGSRSLSTLSVAVLKQSWYLAHCMVLKHCPLLVLTCLADLVWLALLLPSTESLGYLLLSPVFMIRSAITSMCVWLSGFWFFSFVMCRWFDPAQVGLFHYTQCNAALEINMAQERISLNLYLREISQEKNIWFG